MVMLSKNVVRSMNTDIKNKLEKANKYRQYAEALEAEATALSEFVIKNSQEEGQEQVKIIGATPLEQAIEQPVEQVIVREDRVVYGEGYPPLDISSEDPLAIPQSLRRA